MTYVDPLTLLQKPSDSNGSEVSTYTSESVLEALAAAQRNLNSAESLSHHLHELLAHSEQRADLLLQRIHDLQTQSSAPVPHHAVYSSESSMDTYAPHDSIAYIQDDPTPFSYSPESHSWSHMNPSVSSGSESPIYLITRASSIGTDESEDPYPEGRSTRHERTFTTTLTNERMTQFWWTTSDSLETIISNVHQIIFYDPSRMTSHTDEGLDGWVVIYDSYWE